MNLTLHPQFIRTATEELVVLTRTEFDALVATAERDEDAADLALFDERMSELEAGRDARLPAEVSAAMLHGDSLMKALRKWKDMTQMQVAVRTRLAQGYISDIESGRKSGTPETLKLIADALEIDRKWLVTDGAP